MKKREIRIWLAAAAMALGMGLSGCSADSVDTGAQSGQESEQKAEQEAEQTDSDDGDTANSLSRKSNRKTSRRAVRKLNRTRTTRFCCQRGRWRTAFMKGSW